MIFIGYISLFYCKTFRVLIFLCIIKYRVSKMKEFKKIGILTGGGDCPGLNAVIRAVVKTAINDYGVDVIGFKDGYEGLVENKFLKLSYIAVSGILRQGGTILGTSNKADPFKYPVKKNGKIIYRDLSNRSIKNLKKNKLDALICVGGDGTLSIAYKLCKKGINIIGIPKTIDNDVNLTDATSGFDSALVVVTDAIDKLQTTAQSHHRVMIVEVMGRYAGWLGLHSGIAGGADVILIPEIPFDLKKIAQRVLERSKAGKRFSIIVVSEGAMPKGGEMVVKKLIKDSPDPIRLGGIGNYVSEQLEKMTGLEVRVTALGHVQRGGAPTAYDRILATKFGSEAVRLIAEKKFGSMVALKGREIISVPIAEAIKTLKKVSPDSPLLKYARSVGTSFGD